MHTGFSKIFWHMRQLAACVFMAFCTLGKSQYLRGQVTTQEPLLSHGDVAINDPGKTTMVHIKIKASKTDPFCHSVIYGLCGKDW